MWLAGAASTLQAKSIPDIMLEHAHLVIGEGNGGTFTAKLDASPMADVTVNIGSGGAEAVTVSLDSLTFTSSDRGSARTVTAVSDSDADNKRVTLNVTASRGGYDNIQR